MESPDIVSKFEWLLPKHKCSLTIEHNPHRDVYEKLADYLENREDLFEFKNEDSKREAIETDEIWTLQWYPDTPVGFHAVAAPSLSKLMEMVEDEPRDYGNPT